MRRLTGAGLRQAQHYRVPPKGPEWPALEWGWALLSLGRERAAKRLGNTEIGKGRIVHLESSMRQEVRTIVGARVRRVAVSRARNGTTDCFDNPTKTNTMLGARRGNRKEAILYAVFTK